MSEEIKNGQRVWVSARWMKEGIVQGEVVRIQPSWAGVRFEDGVTRTVLWPQNSLHTTREAAVAQAEKARQRRIASTAKLLAKLHAMTFDE